MKSKLKTGKTINLVIVITIIAKLFGIVKEFVFSYYYGATALSDAYNIAQTIPVTLFSIVSLSIGTTLIPIINSIREEQDSKDNSTSSKEEKINRFISNLIYILIILCSFFSLIVIIFPKAFVYLFASNTTNEVLEYSSTFLQISILAIFNVSISYVLMSFLKTNKKYILVSLSTLGIPLILIISYFISSNSNYIFLPIGILISQLSQLAILLIASIRSGFRFRRYFSFRDKNFLEVLKLSIPIVIITGLDEINTIIDKNIASGFEEGTISLLSYSTIIPSLLHTIVVTSINVVFFAEISEAFAKNDKNSVNISISEAFYKAFVLMAPATIGILFFAQPIIETTFMRGAFTYDNSVVVSKLLRIYSIQLIPNVFRIFALSVLNANKNTKVQIIIGGASVATNIGLNFLLSHFFGVYGLAIATVCSSILATLLTIIFSWKYIKGFSLLKVFAKPLLLVLISLIIIIPSKFLLYDLLLSTYIQQTYVKTIISVCVCAVVYFSIIGLFTIIKKKVGVIK